MLLAENKEKIRKRLASAYLNAVIRYRDSAMRSNSLQLEMLMLLAGTMRISEAIRSAGAKTNLEFILFATNQKLLSKFARENRIKTKVKIELELDPVESQSVAAAELLSEK